MSSNSSVEEVKKTLEPGLYFLEVPAKEAINSTLLYYIERSLPDHVYPGSNITGNLMAAILQGQLKVIVALRLLPNGEERLQAVATLRISADYAVKQKTLVVYSLSTVRGIDAEVAEKGLEYLKGYAKRVGAKELTARTNIQSVLKMAERVGAKVSYNLTIGV